jgi:hypothetical protein
MAFRPIETIETAERKELVDLLKETARKLIQKASLYLDEDDVPKADDALKMLKTAVQFKEKAIGIEDPEKAKRRESLIGDIRGIVEAIAGGLGGPGRTGARNVIEGTATEICPGDEQRSSEEPDPGAEPVGKVPALPGEIRFGSDGGDSDCGPDQDSTGDSRP